MSDRAPQQVAEIRERHYEPLFGTPEKPRSINDYMDWNQDAIRDLLAALDAERARAEEAERALRDQGEPLMDERFRSRLLRHALSNDEIEQFVDALESREARARAALAVSSEGQTE